MRLIVLLLFVALLAAGCDKVSSPLAPAPEFELREFVVSEEKNEATSYSKAWNSFKGTGTLMARNVAPDRNMLVWLEAKDRTLGADSKPQIIAVLFRGGIGKVEVTKSEYGETSARPDFQWSVLGWQELSKASITVGGSKSP